MSIALAIQLYVIGHMQVRTDENPQPGEPVFFRLRFTPEISHPGIMKL
jgi:hypothetical protein